MLKKHSVAIAIGFILAYFAIPVHASGAVKLRPIVEANKQVLVLPFSSKIQQEEYQAIQEGLLQTLEAGVAAALQGYGIGAEQYAEAVSDGSLKLDLPASGEVAPPLTADSETVPAAELTMMELAKAGGYDYVLTASIVFLQAELKPAIQAGDRKMSSVRAQVRCSFRLTATDGSSRSFSGMSAGEAAKSIIAESAAKNMLDGDGDDAYQVINRAVIAAAQNTARKLADPESGDYDAAKSGGSPYGSGDVQTDSEYYQDSPGKRLKP
ncbi:MAG: hypothetical protein LBM00_09760 [Deltaproteobacteria bacterium]|jgi:hypothetical protein|nr:hypothetical protein [Deltaproteobacteria bacterium]